MRFILIIIVFLEFSCHTEPDSSKVAIPNAKYWITEKLEYYPIDSLAGGGLTVYGSGFAFAIDPNGTARYLGADFYEDKDSVYIGGEPGRTIKAGNWIKNDSTLILTLRLLSKTFISTGESIGQVEADTLFIETNGLIKFKSHRLIPLLRLSNELQQILDSD